MARFLMNAMLASGGYPWTVIRVELRDQYLSALESASVDMRDSTFRGIPREMRASLGSLPRHLAFLLAAFMFCRLLLMHILA